MKNMIEKEPVNHKLQRHQTEIAQPREIRPCTRIAGVRDWIGPRDWVCWEWDWVVRSLINAEIGSVLRLKKNRVKIPLSLMVV